ncbi:hypothetical protein PL11_005680 [Lentilactobacillus curieae]|uniref:Uncharacterized protein n=1 Tax=Lentilactobacillus curieae TaxID=1138822 RepID=A0A1S6QIM2_9LACO|nr:hypothetical protein [Lentilactobacillus curieae]AQW21458.1 hypothetical protein PL11_005680 [Lentilactobacillus curieae]
MKNKSKLIVFSVAACLTTTSLGGVSSAFADSQLQQVSTSKQNLPNLSRQELFSMNLTDDQIVDVLTQINNGQSKLTINGVEYTVNPTEIKNAATQTNNGKTPYSNSFISLPSWGTLYELAGFIQNVVSVNGYTHKSGIKVGKWIKSHHPKLAKSIRSNNKLIFMIQAVIGFGLEASFVSGIQEGVK